jgi:hypothetical protein
MQARVEVAQVQAAPVPVKPGRVWVLYRDLCGLLCPVLHGRGELSRVPFEHVGSILDVSLSVRPSLL